MSDPQNPNQPGGWGPPPGGNPGQPPYGQPPMGGQPPYGQPPMGGQPPYGQPPMEGGYGVPPQGYAPGYGPPPNYGPLSDKDWTTTLILSVVVGSLGVDRFYLGYTGLGVLKLLTAGGCGIWWIIDLIMIAQNKLPDAQGRTLRK